MFHERLAETYLHLSRVQKKLGNTGDSCQSPNYYANMPTNFTIASEHALYSKLLKFIDESQHYHLDRLFGLLPSDGKLSMFSDQART
jgi:Vam6/Vps39-like protein vacuolar protein sorting-associated protein 39